MKKNPITNLRKMLSASLVAAPTLLIPASAWATLPGTDASNLSVSNGSTISTQATVNTLNISVTNGATNTILTWGAFGIDAGDTVNFNLSNASSAILNRVTGGAVTNINGGLISNGKVFVLNPAGITIGSTAQINTGSFVASTINDTDAVSSFQASNDLSYTGATAGALNVNGAEIKTVGSTGNVVLAGTSLTVDGLIDGNLTVKGLHTGSTVTLGNVAALQVTGNVDVKSFGGNVYLGGGASVTIDGATSTVSTAGNLANGNVSQTAGLIFSKAGATLTVDAAGTYNLTQGSVDLTNSANQLKTVSAKASTVDLRSTTDIDIGNITTASTGHLYVVSDGKLSTSGSIITPSVNLRAVGALTVSGLTSDSVYLSSSTDNVTFSGSSAIVNGVHIDGGKDINFTNSGKISSTVTLHSMGLAGDTTVNNSGEITGDLNVTAYTGLAKNAVITNSGKIDGNLTVNAQNSITVTDTAGVVGNVALQTTDTTGTTSISYTGTGDVTFTNLQSSGISVSSSGKVTTPFIYDNGAGTGTAKDVSITSTGDTVVLNAGIYNTGKLTISTAKDFTLGREIGNASSQPTEISITSGGAIAVDGGWGVLGGKASLTAAKDLSIGSFINVGTGTITVKSTGGNITQAAALTAATLTVDSGKAATLTDASNAFTNLNLTSRDSASAVSVTNSLATTVKSASTAGAATLTSGDITLGSTTSDSLVFNGALTLAGVSSSNVTDTAKNIKVGGNLTFGANINNVTLDASGHDFGTVKGAILGDALITEATALDFGALTVSGNLKAFSTGSEITNSGALSVTGTTQVAAGTASAPGNITLTNAGNSFGGTITIGLDNSSTPVAGAANVVAITNSATSGTTDIAASKIVTSLTLVAANDVTDSGVIQVPTATITAAGKNVVLDAGTKFGTLTVNSAGGNIVEADDITLNGTQTGSLALTTNAGNVVLGTISSTGALTVNTQATAGKTITDNSGLLSIWGNTTLNTKGGAITIANGITNGDNFGGVFLNTNNGSATGANATFTESGVIRFSLVDTGSAGNLTATAVGGILLRDAGDSITTKNAILNATSGWIDIKSAATSFTVTGNATYTAGTTVSVGLGTTTGNIVATGGGNVSLTNSAADYTVSGANVSITNTGATKLNTISATGTLGVTSTGAVTQDSGKSIVASGDLTVSAAGSDVTLANSGNQFGKVSVTSANLTIKEDTTLNLKNVTTGTLTAQSADSIVNSGAVVASGITTLTAPNGISLTNAGNQFDQIVATTTNGDLSITDSSGSLQINGGTSVVGNATFKNTASGTVSDFGVISVSGKTTFDGANISILNPNSSYGSVVFVGGTVHFVQNGTVNLAAGSSTTGSVTVESAKGDIVSNGASTYGGNLSLISAGNITFVDPVMVLGTLSVNAPGTSDLSVLSKAANLNGGTPVNAGTGTVVDPKP